MICLLSDALELRRCYLY